MGGNRTGMGRLAAAAFGVVLIGASCNAPTASPSPTSGPTATQVPAASAPIARATGGTVSVPGGPTLSISAGGVTADATATIRASTTAVPGEGDAWPATRIGPAWDIDIGPHSLTAPATLTFHFDPASLPAGLSAHGLLVAALDPTGTTWTPVPATIDAAGTAMATITHLSTWGLFRFDLDRWLVTLKALASGQITELTTAFAGLLSSCMTSGGGFTIDNALANKMVQGCLAGTPTKGTAAVVVTNLRAFALGLSSPRGYIDAQLVAPGDSVPMSVPNTDVPPATVSATMTTEGLWWSVTDIVLRLLPGWTTLKASPDYKVIVAFTAAGTKAVWDASKIGDDVAAGKYAQAAEETLTLLTGQGYLDALVGALQAAATKYRLPWLAVVDAASLAQILKVVNLADLIVTTWSFFGDYFFNAQATVSVGWAQATKPKAPTNVTVRVTTPDGDFTCDSVSCYWPIRLTWRDNASNETGYVIYATALTEDNSCSLVPDGSRRIVAKLPANSTGWQTQIREGQWGFDALGLRYSVAATNSLGSSAIANAEDLTMFANCNIVGP